MTNYMTQKELFIIKTNFKFEKITQESLVLKTCPQSYQPGLTQQLIFEKFQ